MLQNWVSLSKKKSTGSCPHLNCFYHKQASNTVDLFMWNCFFFLFSGTVNIFGIGAVYCTLRNTTVVIICLPGCWAVVCALNKKREARNINLPAYIGPRSWMQSDDLLLSGHMFCSEWFVRVFSFPKNWIIYSCTTRSYNGYFNQWLHEYQSPNHHLVNTGTGYWRKSLCVYPPSLLRSVFISG